MKAAAQLPSREDKLKDVLQCAFSMYDIDNSGEIDRQEFIAMMKNGLCWVGTSAKINIHAPTPSTRRLLDGSTEPALLICAQVWTSRRPATNCVTPSGRSTWTGAARCRSRSFMLGFNHL